MTHKVRYSVWKSEHDDSVQNTDVDSEFESIRCNNPEKIPGEGFALDASSVLRMYVS